MIEIFILALIGPDLVVPQRRPNQIIAVPDNNAANVWIPSFIDSPLLPSLIKLLQGTDKYPCNTCYHPHDTLCPHRRCRAICCRTVKEGRGRH